MDVSAILHTELGADATGIASLDHIIKTRVFEGRGVMPHVS